MFLSGKPFTMCSQVFPASELRNAPSREATTICESGVMAMLRILVTYEASVPCFQVSPLSLETSTLVRVAATIMPSCACTAVNSCLPITGPPLQLLPSLRLVNRPELVAANHIFDVNSMSFTLLSMVDFTAVLLATVVRFAPFFTVRVELFSLITVLIGCHWLPSRAIRKTPLLVPATNEPFAPCFRVNTSRPPKPEVFCVQCWPPSREANTPPNSRSLTTPT